MRISKFVRVSVVVSLVIFFLLLFIYFQSITNLKQSHQLIEFKYREELDALVPIAVDFDDEPTQESLLLRKKLNSLFSSRDFYSVIWTHDQIHGGGFIKRLPFSRLVRANTLIYSENHKGDRLYNATSADGVRLYYYVIHIPDAKVAKYFHIMFRKNCVGR